MRSVSLPGSGQEYSTDHVEDRGGLQRVAYVGEHRRQCGTHGGHRDDGGDSNKADEQAVLEHGSSTLITDETSGYFGQN